MYNPFKKKVLPILILLLISIIAFSACSKVGFKVEFIVDDEVYETVISKGGKSIKRPTDPEKEGYTFGGWYWDKDIWEEPFGESSLLDKAPNENISVYAKWGVDSNIFTATFVTNGGTSVQDFKGSIIHCSPLTQKDNNNFVGWYTDSSFNESTMAVFPYTLTENATFYAKWALNYTEALEFSFQADSSSYSITGYTGTESSVIVPDTYNGVAVTEIGARAFKDNLNIKEIIIPDSVEVIGREAFYNCSSLTSIVIPDSVTSVGNNAFSWCSSLTSIVIPDSVTSIGEQAFYNCNSLIIYTEVLNKPSGWDSNWNVLWKPSAQFNNILFNVDRGLHPVYWGITDKNLYETDSLKFVIQDDKATIVSFIREQRNISIPKTITLNGIIYDITTIGNYAFSNCDSLTGVIIPDGVHNIGEMAFYNCDNLATLEIGTSVISIGDYAFYNCRSLSSIEIFDSVTSIGSFAFGGCNGLAKITIPDSITGIGSGAFVGCSNLINIEIPVSVLNIGDYVFWGCSSLTIYAKVSSKPSGWNNSWNYGSRPVVWGHIGE